MRVADGRYDNGSIPLETAGGPYLFGRGFTAADAFFAPMAARFATYGVELDAASRAYVQALLVHSATQAFYADAQTEAWVMAHNEFGDG